MPKGQDSQGKNGLFTGPSTGSGQVVFFPRMTALVSLLQVGDVELGVVVQGLKALVSQELLDVVEVGIALDHLACAGPPERVRGDGKVHVKTGCIFPNALAHGVLRQRRAMICQEDSVGGGSPGGSAVAQRAMARQVRSHAADVGGQPFEGGLANGNEAFLPPLPDDAGNAALQIQVGEGEPFQFADSDAGRVKQLNGGPVADAGRLAGVDPAHELPHLGMGEHTFRQKLGFADVGQLPGQGAVQITVLVEQIQEDTNALDDGVDGGGLQRQTVLGEALGNVRLESVNVFDGQGVGGGDAVMIRQVVEEQPQR